MPRIRSVKPDFWSDEKLAKVSRESRLIFIALWNFCDDYGVTQGDPSYLRSQVFPYDHDVSVETFASWLLELEKYEFIVRMLHHGNQYYFLPNFLKHQKIDHPSNKRFPDPSEMQRKSSRGLARAARVCTQKSPLDREGEGDRDLEDNIAQAQILKTEPELPPAPPEATEEERAKEYKKSINDVVSRWMINKMPVYRDVIGGIPYMIHDVWLPYRPSPREMKEILDTFYYNCVNPRVVLANMIVKGDVKGEQISKVRREYSERTELPFSL